MFQFSRAIYRELAPFIKETRPPSQNATNQELVLQECESAIQRIVTDRRHFARPARTLFANVRPYFAISDLGTVFATIERNVDVATRFIEQMPECSFDVETPRHCQATTRKGTPCRRQPLVRSEYCPSHQHLTESFEDLQLQQGELELLEFGQIDLAA